VIIGKWVGEFDREQAGRVFRGEEPFDETTMLDDVEPPAPPSQEAVEKGLIVHHHGHHHGAGDLQQAGAGAVRQHPDGVPAEDATPTTRAKGRE
jgi:hypothetical protein